MAMNQISTQELARINKEKGQYFFSPSSMKFFGSRVSDDATMINGKAYFVSSEQYSDGSRKSPRRYTVRVMDMESGSVDTVGEFQEYSTRSDAYARLKYAVDMQSQSVASRTNMQLVTGSVMRPTSQHTIVQRHVRTNGSVVRAHTRKKPTRKVYR